METKRQLDVLDRHLSTNQYMCGLDYSIADIAIWPWYGVLALGQLYEAGEFLDVSFYENVQRWAKEIGGRKTVERGRMVNRTWGEDGEQVQERHGESSFDGKIGIIV
jgi:GST-like protein